MFIKDLINKDKVIGASETEVEVGTFSVTDYSSLNLRVGMVVSAVSGTVTVKLQGRVVGGDYEDLSSANSSITVSNGSNSIRLNKEVAADQADMPLTKDIRVVVTTAAASGVTINRMAVQL